jgi:uncharacterized protein
MSETHTPDAPRNVLGTPLQACSFDPLTGYFRDGCCNTAAQDTGTHVICMTPRPDYRFRGLKPGDRWCLCALRWKEAFDAGVAPPVVLEATQERALAFVGLEALLAHEWTPSGA